MPTSKRADLSKVLPAVRCTARKQNGEPCRAMAARGATVCRVHGGSAPQVKAAAKRRIDQAAEALVQRLLGFALDGDVPDAVALAAVKDALDRAGLGAKQSLELSPKPLAPWEEMFMDFAATSRERHRALEQLVRRGESLPDALAQPAVRHIVDVEVVPPPEAHDYSPKAAVGGADRPDAADVLDDELATPTAPEVPPPEAVTYEEAPDIWRTSQARTGRARRKRGKRRQ